MGWRKEKRVKIEAGDGWETIKLETAQEVSNFIVLMSYVSPEISESPGALKLYQDLEREF